MTRNKIDDAEFVRITNHLNIPPSEVQRAVYSFFGIILREARSLPFNNCSRIYRKERFDDLATIRNLPAIGRIGPIYSRYLKWRSNEASANTQVSRSRYRARISQSEIENMAGEILSGKVPSPVKRKKATEIFSRIWMIGSDGKKLARQVIQKEEDNGIQY